MRIMLAISSLGPGGAERVMTILAGALAERGHEVWLVTLARSSADFYPVEPRVRRIALGISGESPNKLRAVQANVQRLCALRRVISTIKPQALVSFVTSTNVLAVLACVRLPVRVVISERVDPVAHRENRAWATLRSIVYRHADAVVVQTEKIAEWFRAYSWKRVRIVVIPNPVIRAPDEETTFHPPGPFLLAAGRLTQQKGFDLLIRAFAETRSRPRELQLVIAGEGPESQPLCELAAGLGLAAQVIFPGRVRNLSALMKAAVAFILPSRYEGFPNVLLEALAAGVPCVAADGPGAVREILGDGAYGLLVPPDDPAALAGAIKVLLADAALRQRLSRAAAAAIERYGLDRVVNQWEQVLAGA